MNAFLLFLVVLIPCIGGALTPVIPWKKRTHMMIYLEGLVIVNSILVWMLLFNRPEDIFTLVNFTGDLKIAFQLDGLGSVFAGLVSFLWPFATLYSFEYMTKEHHEKVFFMFYTMTYGVTLGISLSDNMLTMYCFYELLTLVTLPLVMHTLTREAILASRKYLYYSIGGAAFAFIGMIFIIIYGENADFVLGGILNGAAMGAGKDIFLLVYVFAFFGFGVKAALCPFHSWLPQAGVAPTPVTALLHAVAVVKSGAFAIMRLTYYCFGADFVRGTWAQYLLMAVILFTIVYGCSMAVKETHIKRRLAYSTVSNLSYILFGVVIMTPAGLVGALSHMVFHAFMKICSFFCAGAIMHQTERHYVHQLDGFGRKMPKVFAIFTVSALALMGVPGLCGFISKWNLAEAAIESGNVLAYFGIGALLVSALLTAIYMLTMVIRAYFPRADFDYETISDVRDPNWMMLLPLAVFVVGMVVFGLYSAPITDLFTAVAQGSF
ncbi:MAG: proton-conducting membrane transporter [Lachnospiraceae bacterium]|nr:proton-conducting membrane transporter [Lachnospiraceae bacterium]